MKLMALDPCEISALSSGRMAPRLSDGRMKPRPTRPTRVTATSSHSAVPGRTSTMHANDTASSASPVPTSSGVGRRSARRPTSAMVTASAMPAGSMMVPTCEADSCSPSCMNTGSR